MRNFVILMILMTFYSCASTSKSESYHERMRNSKDKTTTSSSETSVLNFQIPLIWYVEKF